MKLVVSCGKLFLQGTTGHTESVELLSQTVMYAFKEIHQ